MHLLASRPEAVIAPVGPGGDAGFADPAVSDHRPGGFQPDISHHRSEQHPWTMTGGQHHGAFANPAKTSSRRRSTIDQPVVINQGFGPMTGIGEQAGEPFRYSTHRLVMVEGGKTADDSTGFSWTDCVG